MPSSAVPSWREITARNRAAPPTVANPVMKIQRPNVIKDPAASRSNKRRGRDGATKYDRTA